MTVQLWAQELSSLVRKPLKLFQFPGGEYHIDLPESNLVDVDSYRWIAEVKGADANDLVAASLLANIARDRGEHSVLMIPYLPAARADRGLPLGIEVYGDIIDVAGFDQVITIDAHNPEAAHAAIPRLTNLSAAPIVAATMQYQQKFTGVIAPDKGAIQRAKEVADLLRVREVVCADKERDFTTGRILSIECPTLDPWGNYLVVDDICDGGGTFALLKKATCLCQDQISLWVTHGIFSGDSLLKHDYKAVYTTDSHPDSSQLGKWTVKTPVFSYMYRHIEGAN